MIYTGRVQGVGFRMTVHELARHFPVVGVVRNVTDGSVELITVGEAKPIMDFLKAIDDRMSRNIVGRQLDWMDALGEDYPDFSVGSDKVVGPG
jgi:acylphosphatase